MVKIKLNKGYEVLVDDDDYIILNRYHWNTSWYKCTSGIYLAGVVGWISEIKKNVLMHRFILNIANGDKLCVDHIDGNVLNNQKLNLRICNRSQNLANQKKQKSNTSGYKGVSYINGNKKFKAAISFKNKDIFIGYFNNPLDAAVAYNNAAIKYFGEFSKLNTIPSSPGKEV